MADIKSDPVPDITFEDPKLQQQNSGVFGPASGMEDFEVEISDDPLPDASDPYASMSARELAAKLKAEEARIRQLEEQANMNAALSQSISQLGMNLNRPQEEIDPIQASLKQLQNDPTAQQASPLSKRADESEADYKTRLQEEYYNDPVKMNDLMFSTKVGPLMTQMMTMNLTHARRSIELDPNRSETYKKYRSEIDRMVAEMDPRSKFQDTSIFEKAHDQVVARHIQDIVNDRVQEALKQQTQNQTHIPQANVASSPTFMETMSTPVRGGNTNVSQVKPRLTTQEKEYCDLRGLSYQDYYRWKYQK